MSLSPFELLLLDALLSGDHPTLELLRDQFEHADVTGREVKEMGFTTYFEVPDTVPKAPADLDAIDDLQLDLKDAKAPAYAALQLKDGRVHALECHVYDGTFPAEPEIVSAWYYGTEKFPGITDELIEARDVEAAVGEGEVEEGGIDFDDEDS